MKLFTFSVIALSLLISCWSLQGANAENVRYIDVRDLGAVGNGESDDTQAIQNAVMAAKERGVNVFIPKGEYLISETIELENVGITGPEIGAWNADLTDVLPSIIPATTDTMAFHMGAAASLKGLDISYKGVTNDSGGAPAIMISGIGVYIANMRIRYAWDGILTDGENNVGRLNIDNVFMVTIRNVGVRVIGTWDVPRLNNIEIWNTDLKSRAIQSGIGFHLLKNDLIRLTDCFVFAMHYGFLLEEELEGASISGGTWGVMNGCSTDFCGIGVAVKGAHTLSVSGGCFWNHAYSLLVDGEEARVRMTGSELKSNGTPAVDIRESLQTVVSGCTLSRYMESHVAPAVVISGGKSIITSNSLRSSSDGVVIKEGVEYAMVTNNMIECVSEEFIIDDAIPKQRLKIEGNGIVPKTSDEDDEKKTH